MKNRKMPHNIAEEDIIQLLLGTYSTIDTELCENLAGDIFRLCGYVEISCKWMSWVLWKHKIFSTINYSSFFRDEKYVALKVVKSAPHYTETAADEICLLEAIRNADAADPDRERIVRLLNHFTVRGVNGVHTCLVFEALGCSLYKLIVKNNYQGLAIPQVKSIIKQVLEGLNYLHVKCSIIHTDIKPENILLVIDNAAAMNQQIDDEINSLRVQGMEFPDSYSKTDYNFF